MSLVSDSRQKVIIDTDIGDDIDDALALFLALRSPELEIAGITTVYKNVQARAQIVSSMLHAAGRSDIPVIPGASRPLLSGELYGKPVQLEEMPFQFLDEMREQPVSAQLTATEFIIQTALQAEQPITLITLGALTNVALALRVKPEIAAKISKIVVMGGAYDMNVSEYNFSCDPIAAQIVLGAGIKIIAVGLDVTFRCLLSDEQTAAFRESKDNVAKLIMKMRQYWLSHHIYLHDPLAIAVAYREDFVTLERRKIDIETRGEYTRGMCINLSGQNWHQNPEESDIWVCTAVDSAAFMDFYMKRTVTSALEKESGCFA
ncbi:nucleoside hydrolase [Paenibacillus sp. GCM10027626]|uniref:nucleoside hydrolase n=1 Tax=Paenibacillus sp. GCM10027626 TaxID=3273411 RepID=UPI0036336D4D